MTIPGTAIARAEALLRRLPDDQDIEGVEVGVWKGHMSQLLLTGRSRLTLYMVDRWAPLPRDSRYAKSERRLRRTPKEKFDSVARWAAGRVAPFDGRGVICRGESKDWAEKLSDKRFDFVFLDADHTYEGVRDDIGFWRPLVKPGGWLCGHDIDDAHHPEWGVRKAVEEYIENYEGELELDQARTWFIKV